jgi:pilus assembly protein Flp/PilA
MYREWRRFLWKTARQVPEISRSIASVIAEKPGQDHNEEACRTLLKDESCVTAIDYGLIATGLVIAIIAAVNGLGTALSGTFSTVSTSLK